MRLLLLGAVGGGDGDCLILEHERGATFWGEFDLDWLDELDGVIRREVRRSLSPST